MEDRLILDQTQFSITIDRLCHQLLEDFSESSEPAIIGVQPRGVQLSERIISRLGEFNSSLTFLSGKLDASFYRDDFRRHDEAIMPRETDITFSLDGKHVVLVDDVLYTGRTIRSALDAVMDFGRPSKVELLVLIDRRMQRHLPIQATYVGQKIDSIRSEKVLVNWKETSGIDEVWISQKPGA